uniref:Uncharacterized protein n=1 Tax=Anguilla anguilla TaxID=7936 RepID=A0A0E9RD36_ANGAN
MVFTILRTCTFILSVMLNIFTCVL